MNEKNLSPGSQAPAPQRYLVALPTGTEGPYTIEELRGQLRARRLDPADRVLCEGDKKSQLLSELIPDAATLQVKTDRVVRRKSSDGDDHRVEASVRGNPVTDSQARRYRTPLNVAALPPEPMAQPAATMPAPSSPNRRPLHLVVVSGMLAICLAVILWQGGVFDSYGGGHPGLRWNVTFRGMTGGPWTLILNGRELTTISPTRQSSNFNVQQTFETGGRMRLRLSQPHPQLGSVVTISSTNPAEVVLDQDQGSGEVLH